MKSVTGVFFALLVFLLLSPIAQANTVKKLNLTTDDGFSGAATVSVYSTQGEKWDKVDKTVSTKFRIGLNAECKYEGKGNKAYRGSLSVAGFSLLGSYEPANFLIPNAKNASGTFRWESGEEQPTSPVKVCSDELAKRLSADADLTRYHVLSKGRCWCH